VGADQIEKGPRVRSKACRDVAFHVGQHDILIDRRESRERRTARGACVAVDGRKTDTVGLAERQQPACKGAIDVPSSARLASARSFIVGWNEAHGDGFEHVGFNCR
jgi:hypothetical protein